MCAGALYIYMHSHEPGLTAHADQAQLNEPTGKLRPSIYHLLELFHRDGFHHLRGSLRFEDT